MQTIQEHRARVQSQQRAARQLLDSKGARKWTSAEQLAFDALLDDADRSQAAIDATALRAYHSHSLHADARQAVEAYIRKKPQDYSDEERRRIFAVLSTSTPSQGGYSVPSRVSAELVSVLKGVGPMRLVARHMPTEGGGVMSIATSDGTSEVGEIVAQNITTASVDPTFGTAPINTARFSSKVFAVPFELLNDSAVDIVSFVYQRASERIGRRQNLAFTTGTGTNEPTGLITASGTGKVGLTGQTVTVIYDDLVDMIDSVDDAQLSNPNQAIDPSAGPGGWMFNQTTRKMVRRIKDSNGRPIWLPSYDEGFAEKTQPHLLGYPVYINNDMAVPAANAKSIAFGGFHKYVVRDVLDVSIFRMEDSAYATRGQVGFLVMARAGGNLTDSSAVTLYQHSAT
jgi:HK97 family phage major capsid protein